MPPLRSAPVARPAPTPKALSTETHARVPKKRPAQSRPLEDDFLAANPAFMPVRL